MNDNRWLDHTGLNLIRIVIGSYFMAVSVGLVAGVDPAALLRPVLPATVAEFAGMTLLFALATAYMAGVSLHMVSLALALFVLSSSVATHLVRPGAGTVGFFWRDLALVCTVLLSYVPLRRRELRRAVLIMRRRTNRIRRGGAGPVRPRRVKIRKTRGDDGAAARLSPAITPTAPAARPDIPSRHRQRPVESDESDESDEINNIFVNN